MASSTRADLLHDLPLAIRSQGQGGLTTAADLRGFLAAMLEATYPEAGPALPVPQLQIRRLSHYPAQPDTPERGLLPSPGGSPTAAAGPVSTANYLRVSFGAPLPASVLAEKPEIWLFTYHNRQRRRTEGDLRLHRAGWGHPCPATVRRGGAYWGGANSFGAATEFATGTVRETLGLALPYADLVIDANHWFALDERGKYPRPHGKKGRVRRFRFALVTNAPADRPTPSGKCIGPLSDEVWLSVAPQLGANYCAFHAPVYNHVAKNQDLAKEQTRMR